MIGRLLRGGFMSLIYAYLYIPIIILIVNSFNQARFGINRDVIDPTTVTCWSDFWDAKYKGSLLLTDDAREVFQIALRKLGYSANTTDPKEIEATYSELKKLMPNVLAFNSDNPGNPFMEGEVNLGMVWNGSAYVARQAGTPLEVIWPKEGG